MHTTVRLNNEPEIVRSRSSASGQPLCVAICLAVLLTAASFLVQGNIGFSLADEGFLWDGVRKTLSGQVPIRDFNAYDPGRYYWCAFWSTAFGDGILGLRCGIALITATGLSFGLLAAQRVVKSYWKLSLLGSCLLLWMFPWHKAFESAVGMVAVYVCVLLIEAPSLRRHALCGTFVGFSCLLGRNLCLYNLVASLALVVLIHVKTDAAADLFRFRSKLACWAAGVAVGLTPLAGLLLLVPGYAAAYRDIALGFLIRQGTTNLRLPIPWPWQVDYGALTLTEGLIRGAIGTAYVWLFLFAGWAIFTVIRIPHGLLARRALFVAGSLVGLAYLHHALSRADVAHLAQVIHPLLLAAVGAAATDRFSSYRVARLCVFLLVPITLLATLPGNRIVHWLGKRPTYVRYDLSGEQLWLQRRQADYLGTLESFVKQHVLADEQILIAPFEPGAYGVLDRLCPIWNSYLLWPASASRQRQLIQSLSEQNVNWVVIRHGSIDGRNATTFPATHAIVWQHLRQQFCEYRLSGLPDEYQVLRRIGPSEVAASAKEGSPVYR